MTDNELTLFATEWCEKEPANETELVAKCSDEQCGYVFSLHTNVVCPECFRTKWERVPVISPGGFWCWSEAECKWIPTHDFATDFSACALFEALVEGREVWSQYVDDMLFVLGLRHEPGSVPITPFEAWALYRAPPRARCLALVAMVGGDDE